MAKKEPDLTDPSTWPSFKVVVVRYKTIREHADIVVQAPDQDIAMKLATEAVRQRQKRRKVKWTDAKCVESSLDYVGGTVELIKEKQNEQSKNNA